MALLLRGKICIEYEVFDLSRNWLAPFPADRIHMIYVTNRCDDRY